MCVCVCVSLSMGWNQSVFCQSQIHLRSTIYTRDHDSRLNMGSHLKHAEHCKQTARVFCTGNHIYTEQGPSESRTCLPSCAFSVVLSNGLEGLRHKAGSSCVMLPPQMDLQLVSFWMRPLIGSSRNTTHAVLGRFDFSEGLMAVSSSSVVLVWGRPARVLWCVLALCMASLPPHTPATATAGLRQ